MELRSTLEVFGQMLNVRRLKARFKKQFIRITRADVRYFDQFMVGEIVFPENEDLYHLKLCMHHLHQSYLATEKTGFSNKYDYFTNSFGPLYPEVSGYILNTLIKLNRLGYDVIFDLNIREMLRTTVQTLLTYQLACGSFSGGHKNMVNYRKPSIFNTGQILLGLVDYYSEIDNCPLVWSAIEGGEKFLTSSVNSIGEYDPQYCYLNRFAPHYCRAAYGHAKAATLLDNEIGKHCAANVVNKILTKQNVHGLIDDWGFNNNWHVLHTVIYTLRGIWEVGRILNNNEMMNAAVIGMNALQTNGRKIDHMSYEILSSDQHPSSLKDEICFTGLAQQVVLGQKILRTLGSCIDDKFHVQMPLKVLKTHQFQTSDNLLKGSLAGSKPFDGEYQPNCSPIWAVKFFADALIQKIHPEIEVQG